MKVDISKALIAVDRVATADEILAAVLPFSDPVEQCAAEILSEVASDAGGFVRISTVELEISFLAEELTVDPDTWLN